jgi:hypothetical protein
MCIGMYVCEISMQWRRRLGNGCCLGDGVYVCV